MLMSWFCVSCTELGVTVAFSDHTHLVFVCCGPESLSRADYTYRQNENAMPKKLPRNIQLVLKHANIG